MLTERIGEANCCQPLANSTHKRHAGAKSVNAEKKTKKKECRHKAKKMGKDVEVQPV